MADKPVIILDFDGTIADSLMATLQVLYDLVHHRPLPRENISELRGMGARAMLHTLHIPLWRALLLAPKTRHNLAKYIDDIELIPGMDQAVHRLAKGRQLFILSSNDVPSIYTFLKKFRLDMYFAGVIGDATPWHKSRSLGRLIKAHEWSRSNVWYVGDRAWDVQAAHKIGIKAVAVAWGYSNLHVLKRSRPEALVFTPEELVHVILAPDGLNNDA